MEYCKPNFNFLISHFNNLTRAWPVHPSEFSCFSFKKYLSYWIIVTAVEADVALLMVTAEQRIFEDGIYDDGSVLGRTVEHAELAFSLGLSKLIVVVNKLDDVTEGESRYNEIVQKLEGCLQNIGFEGVVFLPMSTLYGSNILKGVVTSLVGGGALACLKPLTPLNLSHVH